MKINKNDHTFSIKFDSPNKGPSNASMGLLYFTCELPIKNQPNVGKYTSPMDGMVNDPSVQRTSDFLFFTPPSRDMQPTDLHRHHSLKS